jgi:formylglycine-generating enzyme required for sulfatase activity/tRNA A-37 threonylcarbamoyl transferase component Bud32
MTPRKIGRYEVREQLGLGGMATVYHAYDPHFERDVLIKVLPREFLHDLTFRIRFERESKIVAALQHPHIQPIYDFGEHEGQPYLVMGHMPGGSLSYRIRESGTGLPPGEAARITTQIASALDYTHGQRIIHRDVKSSNIFFDQEGDAFLIDFSIAMVIEENAQPTGSVIVGTPAFMAPEIAEQKDITPAVDIYALGVVLFEMLTGRLPFDADTPIGMLMAHVNKPIPSMRLVRPDLPESVQAVIERAMAKDPSERYQSAGELAADLWAAVAAPGEAMPEMVPVPPPPPEVRPAPARLGELSPLWMGIGGVLLVGLVIGGLALAGVFGPTESTAETASDRTPAPPTPTPVPTLTEEQRARQLAEAGVSGNAEWIPYTEEINLAEMALVPAGCFMMGSDGSGRDERPVHEVCFDEPFWIDVYEVTSIWFASYLNEMGDQTEDGSEEWFSAYYRGIDERGGTWIVEEEYEDHPVIRVTWDSAAAYCEWRGARLPTEAEWEYAARGPDGLVFPWGNEFDCSLGNFDDETQEDSYVVKGGVNCDGFADTAPVGSFPGGASWVGVLDMSGNAWEWMADWYGDGYYSTLPSPITNPTGPDGGTLRVLRGGSWKLNYAFNLRAAYRFGDSPDRTRHSPGFRCARSYAD